MEICGLQKIESSLSSFFHISCNCTQYFRCKMPNNKTLRITKISDLTDFFYSYHTLAITPFFSHHWLACPHNISNFEWLPSCIIYCISQVPAGTAIITAVDNLVNHRGDMTSLFFSQPTPYHCLQLIPGSNAGVEEVEWWDH